MQREELLKEVEQLAYQYERDYGGCSQCVVGAIKKSLGLISDDVFKAATGLAGGVGLTGNTCGALTGGVMVLGMLLGREYDNFADPERIRFRTFELAKKLIERFEQEYGTASCYGIQRKIMGRSYNLWDQAEYAEFLAAGGHEDKCPAVCGKAAKWVAEILLEEDLI
ncbi:MAG: C-GCAxxG-C-C family protein [Bacillota bacterium]|nr:C-GCAxxG-C-C family protein [Bacillota bacterium]MDD3297791.1 C-GCAxxG-C-C family protein [Bacillota bacterium]MDD3850834.1 C-GCAxxG-C-C family protein [Bacillota bacterium]MDD4707536.1 C-GCAxxG-C-C family protein [Bacillota bacterium]